MTDQDLAARLVALEAAHRSLKRSTAAIAAAFVATIAVVGILEALKPTVLDEVRTRNLVVVNKEGKTVVKAFASASGGSLQISTKDGKPAVVSGASSGGGNIDLLSTANNTPAVSMLALAGGGSLVISEPDGNASIIAEAGAGGAGGGSISIVRRDGASASLTASAKGGALSLCSRDGLPIIDAKETDTGGRLTVSNKTGEDVVTLWADEYGLGGVGAWDRNGKGQTLTPR